MSERTDRIKSDIKDIEQRIETLLVEKRHLEEKLKRVEKFENEKLDNVNMI